MSALLKLIPAQPGQRVVELWNDDPADPEIVYEPIIAWAEIEDRPGELVPICNEGDGFRPVLVEPGSFYFDVLHPGQELDLDRARGRIETWRKARLARERTAA